MGRTTLVVAPLLVLLVVAGATGARLLLAEPERADASGAVTCWDGSSASRVADCSRPRGLAGLAWVFPSADLDDPACRGGERRGGARWRCTLTVGGTPVEVVYAGARDARSTLRRVERTYAGGDRAAARAADGTVNRWVWRLAEPDATGSWVVTSVYRQHPWSVTVAAGTRRARDLALRTLVEQRDAAEVRGAPAAG
ncbi:hypothetical protein [Nocardioides abyssi]|uniref:DUF3558 domain-containing protein n=1 Tax=Nocardioides abyssi TaxID=3058370 RepID=A0ABT8ESW3_9ACTN|nr:hypothetical protein [Nocardioides abyssi]MDN4161242.1 hypothetical protein [Nocardioides abyssi]